MSRTTSAVLLVLCLVSSAHAEDNCSLQDRLASKGNCRPTRKDWVFVQGFDKVGGKLNPAIFNALSWLSGEQRWAPADGWQFAGDVAKSHGFNVASKMIGAAATPSIMAANSMAIGGTGVICTPGLPGQCSLETIGIVATGATTAVVGTLAGASTAVAGASAAIAGSAVGGTALGTAAVTAGTATAAALASTAAAVTVAAPAIAVAAVGGAAVYTVRSVFNWMFE
jgi:hypothetical protein